MKRPFSKPALIAEGYAFVDPEGHIELTYFYCDQFTNKDGRAVAPETWRRRFRPKSRLVRATIIVPAGPQRRAK